MLKSVRLGLLATTVLAGLALAASAQDLVTADRVGKADAPNVADHAREPEPVA